MTLTAAAIAALQAAQTPVAISLRDVFQYLGNTAAVGAFAFAWRTNTELTRLKTMITEPETGIAPRLVGTSKQTHEHASKLQGHEIMLDNHERELERLDRDKEPRRAALGPRDVGTLDRRGS